MNHNSALPSRLLGLDALRGAAALAVLIYHTRGFTGVDLLPGAYLAVDLFFLIGGFVSVSAYSKRLAGGMTSAHFIKARAIRLYPIHLMGLFLGLLAFTASVLVDRTAIDWTLPATLLLAMVFLPTFGLTGRGDQLYPLNGPSWSLFLEVMANIVFVAAARHLSIKALAVAIAVSAIVLALSAFHFGTLDIGMTRVTFFAGIPRVSFPFFLGILVARVSRDIPRVRPGFSTLVILGVLLCVVVPSVAGSRIALDALCVFILLPALLVVGFQAEVPAPAGRLIAWLGLISYAVYAIHMPALKLAAGAWSVGFNDDAPAWIIFAVFCPAILVGAHVVTYYLDVPIRAALTAKRAISART